MRVTPLLILLPALALAACGKKDLEAETEATPAPEAVPAPVAPAPDLPVTGSNHPFRVPDATNKLPSTDDTRSATTRPGSTGPVNDSATVTVRPPEASPPTGDNE